MPLISGAASSFNGGMITAPLVVAPAIPGAAVLELDAPVGQIGDLLICSATGGTSVFEVFPTGGAVIATEANGSILLYLDGQAAPSQTADILRAVDKNGHVNLRVSANDGLGFYGHAAATQQALTSATATPEQIALALQANGLCGGT